MNNEEKIKKNLLNQAKGELVENILKFWLENTQDDEFGGFYGRMDNNLRIDKKAPKGSVLCARILWTYSAAYKKFNDEKYLAMAKRAYDYLINNFWDNKYSGVYWLVDYEGKPYDTKKQIYAQAFAIYALSEYYAVTHDKESLSRALELFKAIEKCSYDHVNKGYFEAYSREWSLAEDLRLSEKDMNEKKSMNTHLHVLEGYTNLYRVCKTKEIQMKLKEIIEITIKYIIDDNYHFKLFFDEKWNSKVKDVSYGHDIEGSWLLVEAAEVLNDKELTEKVKKTAAQMARITLEEGIDTDGGLLNELFEDGKLDRDKHWWQQAEAVVGFINAYQLTGQDEYLKAAYSIWEYIQSNIVDKINGEWFWMADGKGNEHDKLPKVDMWKCPYHNSRVCMEILDRLNTTN